MMTLEWHQRIDIYNKSPALCCCHTESHSENKCSALFKANSSPLMPVHFFFLHDDTCFSLCLEEILGFCYTFSSSYGNALIFVSDTEGKIRLCSIYFPVRITLKIHILSILHLPLLMSVLIIIASDLSIVLNDFLSFCYFIQVLFLCARESYRCWFDRILNYLALNLLGMFCKDTSSSVLL